MQLYAMQSSIRKPHSCNTLQFQFAPPAAAVSFTKKGPNFDAWSCRNCLNLLDRADDIEFHYVILCREPLTWQIQRLVSRPSSGNSDAPEPLGTV